MATAFSIDCNTGTIHIGEISIAANDRKGEVIEHLRDLVTGSRDHGNGYEWLDLGPLAFGGKPAALSLCFYQGSLREVAWSVQMPNASTKDGWPTRKEIDAEVAFVRRTLALEMGIRAGVTSWGEVWSKFDPKGFIAAAGLRYRLT